MAGLVPAIHAGPRRYRQDLGRHMDHRVKPGDDEKKVNGNREQP